MTPMRFGIWAVTLAAIATLVSCGPDSDGNPTRTTTVSPNHASVYDPTTDRQPGDNRPTVPSADAIAPELESGEGNSGIEIPVGAAGGKR